MPPVLKICRFQSKVLQRTKQFYYDYNKYKLNRSEFIKLGDDNIKMLKAL